jgi:thioredoxin 1
MHCSPTTNAFQDDRVKPYVDNVIRIGEQFNIPNIETKVRQTKITFGKLGKNHLGICYYNFNEIILSEKDWNRLPPENREEVFIHEIGHCVLGIIGHSNTGIMRASGLYNPVYYKHHYNMLMNELFVGRNEKRVHIKWNGSKYKSSYKENFVTKEQILNNKHAVVRFTATWCPPCKALAPIFDEVAAEHPDVVVYVVDVDQNQDLARDMNIRGIPTMIQIKDGAVTDTKVGAQPKPVVEELFK